MTTRLDPAGQDAEKIYRPMTGIVVPRPIAWVTSLSSGGVLNLAPFSAFTFVAQKPPMLAIGVGRKGAIYKDTAHNILDTEEYVIHIADSPMMNAVHESSVEHPSDVSEVEHHKLETIPSEKIWCRGWPLLRSRWSANSANASNLARPRAGSSSAKS
jgi:flavin reductase (DIM6/NTAB) family NADH-FMN oxidoreductase RutF